MYHATKYFTLSIGVMIISLIVFYASIMANKPYYKEGIKFLNGDLVKMILFTAVGSFVILFSMENIYLFLSGILIITLGNLSVLAKIQKKYLK